jgi:hypothetical protein
MSGRRTAAVALLAVAVAACDAGITPVQPVAPVLVTPAPTVEAIASGVPSPTAKARPTPSPKPTPLPVPSKPTGVKLDMEDEAICFDNGDLCAIGDSIFRMSWATPRTKGVVIRVYGVTKCFDKDASGARIDDHCLRKHTPLPSSVRVLLTDVPASKGKVTWRMVPGRGLGETRDGVPIYSIVLAGYNADGGHSIFAIADAGDSRR